MALPIPRQRGAAQHPEPQGLHDLPLVLIGSPASNSLAAALSRRCGIWRANQRHQQQSVPKRQVIGIGAGVNYTIYDPGSDHLDFLTAGSRPLQRARGFA
jgi:hypothetical protein